MLIEFKAGAEREEGEGGGKEIDRWHLGVRRSNGRRPFAHSIPSHHISELGQNTECGGWTGRLKDGERTDGHETCDEGAEWTDRGRARAEE